MKFNKSRLRINAQALFWRMFLNHKKQWICTILKIVLPSLLFGILVVINSFSPRLKRDEIEVKTYKNEDLFGEIVRELNTTNKPAVILFSPENNLTRDLTNQISLSLNFLIENVLKGASNLGNYFFKDCLISNLEKNFDLLTIVKKYPCFLFVQFIFSVFLQLGSKSNLFSTVIN
jgi:hypothetical protein